MFLNFAYFSSYLQTKELQENEIKQTFRNQNCYEIR